MLLNGFILNNLAKMNRSFWLAGWSLSLFDGLSKSGMTCRVSCSFGLARFFPSTCHTPEKEGNFHPGFALDVSVSTQDPSPSPWQTPGEPQSNPG